MGKYFDDLNKLYDNQKLNELREYGINNDVPIIKNDGLSLLLSVIRLKKAKRVLEVGTAIGYSSIAMALDNEDIYIDTIERNEQMYHEANKNIKKVGYESNINVIFDDALLVDTSKFKKEYDIIFIDAAKAQYQKFFEKYIPYLKDDGIVITDNILFHGCVEEIVLNESNELSKNVKNMAKKLDVYNNYLNTLDEFKTYYLNIGDGLAITVKKCK